MTSLRLLHGLHAVLARLSAHPETVEEIFVAAGRDDARARAIVERAAAAGVPVQRVDAARLAQFAPGARHQGVVARVAPGGATPTIDSIVDDAGADAILVVLDGVTDPHNLGACLRNADAFGAAALIVPKDRASALTPAAAKAASGAAETVPVIAVTNLARTLATLKDRGYWILGADSGGEDLAVADLSGPIAWVFGAEGSGLRRLTRERCDRIIGIPIAGVVRSLNVAVACGICLHATRAARRANLR